MTPRYRLGLAEPLFVISMPLRDFRALTERELDRLAQHLREVEAQLREYDAQAGPLIAATGALPNPWWTELRAALLARGEDQEWLDENCGSCYGAGNEFALGKEPWFAALVSDVVGRVDPTPLATLLPELIARAAALDVGKLVTALDMVLVFHPYGMPHQLQIENLGELFGMPVTETDNGKLVYGYGEEGPPKATPWQTGEVRGRIGEVPTKDPEEVLWIPIYEGLLSWTGEIAEVLQDRTSALLQTRQDTLEHLHYEVKRLAASADASAALMAIAGQLLMLNRLLLGLCEEIARKRRQLIDNLGKVLGGYNGHWRQPTPERVLLQHYLRIGLEPIVVD